MSIREEITLPRRELSDSQQALLEKRLPWLSEQAATILLSSLQSLLRAPEAKMLLLTPVMMVVVFGAMLLRRSMSVRPSTTRRSSSTERISEPSCSFCTSARPHWRRARVARG